MRTDENPEGKGWRSGSGCDANEPVVYLQCITRFDHIKCIHIAHYKHYSKDLYISKMALVTRREPRKQWRMRRDVDICGLFKIHCFI